MYFKSTDGHTGQWAFNTRRLNLHILPSVEKNNGCLIVDSTRRGKRMPDSFSKTIPIWCAVLNCLAFSNDNQRDFFELYTPPNCVFSSENYQISQKIPEFIERAKSVNIDVSFIRAHLRKPLRPIWVTQDSILPDEPPTFEDFYPIILCTASKMAQDGMELRQGYTYVQGAADDHELWARNLNPHILWSHIDQLGQLKGDEELLTLVTQFATDSVTVDSSISNHYCDGRVDSSTVHLQPLHIWLTRKFDPIVLTNGIYRVIIDLTDSQESTTQKVSSPRGNLPVLIGCPLPAGKKGSKELRIKLPAIIARLELESLYDHEILIIDPNMDFSIGVALTISSLFYSLENTCLAKKTTTNLNKPTIRSKLGCILLATKVNPSRATLNVVNSILMS